MTKSQFIKQLKKIVSFPTLSTDLETNLLLFEYLKTLISPQAQIKTIINGNAAILIASYQDDKNSDLAYLVHSDVVSAGDDQFKMKVDQDHLIGRGTSDMKYSIPVGVALLNELIAKKSELSFALVVTSDEEIGGNTTKLLLPKMPNLEFALFGEPTQLQLNNEAKGIMQVKISAKGKSTHGSNPWLGQNAILKLIADLNQFLSANPPPNNYTWETTFNFSQISGGVAINQVPSECTLFCDVRYRPGVSTSQIIDKFNQHFSGSIVEIAKSESAIFTHQKNEFLQKLAIAVKNAGIKPLFSKALGSSDARHCTAMNIPTVVFGPIGDGLHEDHEWVDVESLLKVRKIINQFIKEL